MEQLINKINSEDKNINLKNHSAPDLIDVFRNYDDRRIGMINTKELTFIPIQNDDKPINLSFAIVSDIRKTLAEIFNH